MSWSNILPGVALLGIVIFVHELGHFLAAKLRGVRVLAFSLGFGPAMVHFVRGGTDYRIAWIPLGGYVQMAGDSPGEDGSMPASPDEYLSHSPIGRIVIAVAGPLANLFTGFVVLVLVAYTGASWPDSANRLGAVADTSVAWQSGLREGDVVTAVAGKPVASWIPIFTTNEEVRKDRTLAMEVRRGDSTFTLSLSPSQREPLLSSIHPPSDPPVIGNVVTGMPAYKAGLKEGDRILAVNGHPIVTWDQLLPQFHGRVDQPVAVTVLRDGQRFDLTVNPIDPSGARHGQDGRIGIEPPMHGRYVERHGLLESVRIGWSATGEAVVSVYAGMWLTLSRPLYYREYLGGPIFIAQAASEQARRGFDYWLRFLATINVAIMAFNLLPIPVLDGGHIVWALLQMAVGRALSANGYLRYQKVGLVVVSTLLILILANDPLRLVQRQRALDRAPQGGHVAPGPP